MSDWPDAKAEVFGASGDATQVSRVTQRRGRFIGEAVKCEPV